MHLVSHQRIHWLLLQAIQNRTHNQVKKYYACHYQDPPLLIFLQLLQFCSSAFLFFSTLFFKSSFPCISLISSFFELTCILVIFLICFFHFLAHLFSHCTLFSHPLFLPLFFIHFLFSISELGWPKYIFFWLVHLWFHILFSKVGFGDWVSLVFIIFFFFCFNCWGKCRLLKFYWTRLLHLRLGWWVLYVLFLSGWNLRASFL